MRLQDTIQPLALSIVAGAAKAAGSLVRRPGAMALAAALPMTLAPAASAQWYDDGYDREHYEYEPGEGWHEEEWYDPSDWFNDEPYNYEYEDDYWYDDNYGYDYYDDNDYDDRYYDTYGYTDDYYDGYRDDRDDSRSYGARYNASQGQYRDRNRDSDRYQDQGWNRNQNWNQDRGQGQYQQGNRSGNQPYNMDRNRSGNQSYYQNQGRRSNNQDRYGNQSYYDNQNRYDSQRRYDSQNRYDSRYRSNNHGGYDIPRDQPGSMPYYLDREPDTRGQTWRDRSQTRSYRDGDMRQGQQGQMQGKSRYQGSVLSIATVDADDRPDDHTVLRITMQNGRTVVADFGPELDRNDLPFERGDRVMLTGDRISGQGQNQGMLVVETIATEDKSLKLREGNRSSTDSGDSADWLDDPRETDTRSMDRQNRNQSWNQNQNQNRWSSDEQTRNGQRVDQMRQNQWPVGQRRQEQQRSVTNWNDSDSQRGSQWNQDRDNQDRDNQDRYSQDRYNQQSRDRSTDRNHSGEVTLLGSLSEVRRLGEADDHQFVRVRMENGRSAVFAVSEDKAEKLREHAGDRVKITGKWDTMRGRDVVKLDSVDKD